MSRLLLTGDAILLTPACGVATLTGALSLTVQGSAHPTCDGKALVTPSDLERLSWMLTYSTPTHSVPGSGIATIVMDSVTVTEVTTASGEALVHCDPAELDVEFSVVAPAMAPGSPPTPDSATKYDGTCRMQVAGPRPSAA